MTIAERLKGERERLGMSQEEFGGIGGFGRTTVIAWEQDRAFPNAAFLSDISALGADVTYIITGERQGPAPLLPEEKLLLDRYRASPPALRDAALRVLLGGGQPSGGSSKIKVGGDVGGHVITGGVKNSSITGSKKKK